MNQNPIILHVEAATNLCSVAISHGEKLLSKANSLKSFDHASRLILLIEQCFQQAGLEHKAVNAISVSIGPGSYTGLRIALSTCKGLSLAWNTPIIALPTLEIISEGFNLLESKIPSFRMAMLDARREEVYLAVFDQSGQIALDTRPCILDLDIIADWDKTFPGWVAIGPGAFKVGKYLDASRQSIIQNIEPRAEYMIPLVLKKWVAGDFENIFFIQPIYLKNPNITKSKSRLTA